LYFSLNCVFNYYLLIAFFGEKLIIFPLIDHRAPFLFFKSGKFRRCPFDVRLAGLNYSNLLPPDARLDIECGAALLIKNERGLAFPLFVKLSGLLRIQANLYGS
jgi:hypothetical protein